ncbi:MAG: 1-acyl-sn-glycerol-3-phosphate acyltransferase [Richelia sp.]|nr:1-acyl-sn-glycerol-3-phosphate acyltransferase [Richelia sp.]
MDLNSPLEISNYFLAMLSTQVNCYYQERIPESGSILVVSNHRSLMDAPILMKALSAPIRFACHHYMGQVPLLRDIITNQLGCFPLEANSSGQGSFFQRSQTLLQSEEIVGVFPEGTAPMVKFTTPNQVGKFQRGFAHLALRAEVTDLAVLPVAIVSLEEMSTSGLPLKIFSLFDPSEPLFNQSGLHPVVVYRRVAVLIGKPYWITPERRQQYQGKQVKKVVSELTEYSRSQIYNLIHH